MNLGSKLAQLQQAIEASKDRANGMKLKDFEALPLIKVFFSVDTASGDLLRHEVRRDPSTGLTLTAPRPDMGPSTKETTNG